MLNVPKKSVKFWLGITAAVLALIPIFYMANVGGEINDCPKEYVPAVVLSVFAVAAEIASSVFAAKKISGVIDIVGVVLIASAFALFAVGSALSVVDYLCGIVMFGDPLQTPAIIAFGVVMLSAAAVATAKCFMKVKEKA